MYDGVVEPFFYLTWSLAFLCIWLALFYLRKDLRREMLFVSALFGIAGPFAQLTNVQDWWRPTTITGTLVGFEDVIIGFAIGGIAAILYEEIYRKKLVPMIGGRHASYPMLFLPLFPLLYLYFFFACSLGSAYSAIFAYGICIAYMLSMRHDLVADSFLSGVFMAAVGAAVYGFLYFLHPTFISDFWYLPNVWYSHLVFGIPIGEFLWFFLTGAYIGPLYEFTKRLKLAPFRAK